jgi:replicative DNA helicase
MAEPYNTDSAQAPAYDERPRQSGEMLPPQAVNVEMAILGAILLHAEFAMSAALALLTESGDAFYKEAHALIYQAMVALYARKAPIDIITVAEELRRMGKLEEAGSMYYLTQLTNEVVTAAHIEHHCRIVLEKSLKRHLIDINTGIIKQCYQDSTDAFEVIDSAETHLFKLTERHMRQSYIELNEIVKPLLRKIDSIRKTHTGVTGVPSGYDLLDLKTGGWQNTDLIILAARPSMGKTALALSMARNAAIDFAQPVGVFSLEMSREQLAMRLLCAEARVNMQLVRTGRIREADYGKLATYVGKLEHAKMYIDDTPGLSILELRAKARRMVDEHDVRLIVVDYLQLMSAPGVRESREREIATISRSLKALAKDLNIPIIAISQLNRAVEQRTGGKPMLADLRESGSIEQDADVVLFVHRNKDMEGIPAEEQNKALVIIGKQRNGEIGEVPLVWIGEYARFENLAIQAPSNIHQLSPHDEPNF